MRILMIRNDLTSESYELRIGAAALEFEGGRGAFSMPYSEVNDFCVVKDQKGRYYFTMIGGGRMHEGRIQDLSDLEPFTAALKDKLHGIINIEVRKN